MSLQIIAMGVRHARVDTLAGPLSIQLNIFQAYSQQLWVLQVKICHLRCRQDNKEVQGSAELDIILSDC